MFSWARQRGLQPGSLLGGEACRQAHPTPLPRPASCPEAHVHARPLATGAGWIPSWGLDSPFSPALPESCRKSPFLCKVRLILLSLPPPGPAFPSCSLGSDVTCGRSFPGHPGPGGKPPASPPPPHPWSLWWHRSPSDGPYHVLPYLLISLSPTELHAAGPLAAVQ